MISLNKYVSIAVIGLSVFAFVSTASAKVKPASKAQETAMATCIKKAQSQYRDDGINGSQMGQRTGVYRSCMKAAGYRA